MYMNGLSSFRKHEKELIFLKSNISLLLKIIS